MPMSGGGDSSIVVASAGDRLALQCAVLRGATPLTIGWIKDSSPLAWSNNIIRSINEFTSSLAIESLAFNHAGLYSCSAANEAGRATVSVQVIVQGQFR